MCCPSLKPGHWKVLGKFGKLSPFGASVCGGSWFSTLWTRPSLGLIQPAAEPVLPWQPLSTALQPPHPYTLGPPPTPAHTQHWIDCAGPAQGREGASNTGGSQLPARPLLWVSPMPWGHTGDRKGIRPAGASVCAKGPAGPSWGEAWHPHSTPFARRAAPSSDYRVGWPYFPTLKTGHRVRDGQCSGEFTVCKQDKAVSYILYPCSYILFKTQLLLGLFLALPFFRVWSCLMPVIFLWRCYLAEGLLVFQQLVVECSAV